MEVWNHRLLVLAHCRIPSNTPTDNFDDFETFQIESKHQLIPSGKTTATGSTTQPSIGKKEPPSSSQKEQIVTSKKTSKKTERLPLEEDAAVGPIDPKQTTTPKDTEATTPKQTAPSFEGAKEAGKPGAADAGPLPLAEQDMNKIRADLDPPENKCDPKGPVSQVSSPEELPFPGGAPVSQVSFHQASARGEAIDIYPDNAETNDSATKVQPSFRTKEAQVDEKRRAAKERGAKELADPETLEHRQRKQSTTRAAGRKKERQQLVRSGGKRREDVVGGAWLIVRD